jgi:hypothetical protein
MTRALPPSASIAEAQEGAKLHAPSAARNVDALCEALQSHAPASGQALEIASGTGQHVIAFATALPHLHWYPTEIDSQRRASIDAYAAEAGLTNVAPAALLNATSQGWGKQITPKSLITLANLLHLISELETVALIREAAQALEADGTLILYGPFKRDGLLTSDGDAEFDAELRAADPAIGYKDTLDIIAWLGDAGLTAVKIDPMPANNLAFIARKPIK